MGLTQFGEKLELRSEIELDVAPTTVWSALFDFPKLCRWNPFWANANGRFEVGGRIALELSPPGGKTLRLHRRIRVFEVGRELVWSGGYGWGWLLRTDQFLRFSELGKKKTRLAVGEDLRGPGVTSNNQTILDIARGQTLMNQALKRYLET
jgi:hypothetical protein